MADNINTEEILAKLVEISEEDLSRFHKNDTCPDTWTDFWAMCEDIREHAKNNGRAVECQDYPMELKLGYHCKNTDKVWKIRITDMKKSLDSGTDQTKADVVRKCTTNRYGKEELVKILNNKD